MKQLLFTLTLLLMVAESSAAELRLPSFLPEFYAPILKDSKRPLVFVSQRETNGVAQFLYSAGSKEMVLIESVSGDVPACQAAFNNILGHLNQVITTNKGAFIEITETEIHAKVVLTNAAQDLFIFVLPHSVNIWTCSRLPNTLGQFSPSFPNLLALVNRHRYEKALIEGNVSMGHWQTSIRNHANALLKTGEKAQALLVLKNLLSTSPFDYEAHLALMENTSDLPAATNSAKVVFKNAEDSRQITRAASFMGIEVPTWKQVPVLGSNDSGIEVVLIPIPPYSPWLLEAVASTYQRITDVPVKIRRLDREWSWGPPDRIARQRQLEGILVKLAKGNIDFSGWNQDRYLNALTNALKSEDAASKYWGNDLAAKVKAEPGQYRVDSYMEALSKLLKPYRTKDARTMYVGITEANIYGSDNNYLFSAATTDPESPVSLLSYYMMLGKSVSQGFDSRQRLVERMAKELVPASLKQLRIPRSADPTCPYSYSSSIERLDQKTLTLSDEVKRALNKLREI